MYDWLQEQDSNLQSQTGYEPGMLPLHYPAIFLLEGGEGVESSSVG